MPNAPSKLDIDRNMQVSFTDFCTLGGGGERFNHILEKGEDFCYGLFSTNQHFFLFFYFFSLKI